MKFLFGGIAGKRSTCQCLAPPVCGPVRGDRLGGRPRECVGIPRRQGPRLGRAGNQRIRVYPVGVLARSL